MGVRARPDKFSRKSAHYRPSGGQKTYENQPKLRFPDANVKSF